MQEFLYDFFITSVAPGMVALLCGVIGYYTAKLTKLSRYQYVYWTLALVLGFFLPVIAHASGIYLAEKYVDTPTPEMARFFCVTIPFGLFLLLCGAAWGSGHRKPTEDTTEPVDEPPASDEE